MLTKLQPSYLSPMMPGLLSRTLTFAGIAIASALLTCGLSGCITIPHGLIGRDGPDTARRISSAIPDGTSELDTKRIMESHGYRCFTRDDEPYDDPVSGKAGKGRILNCSAMPGVSAHGGFVFPDEYYVGFLISAGHAHLIFSRIDITGS